VADNSSKGTYEDFLAELRKAESTNRYHIKNMSNHLGAYQMSEIAMEDAGFYVKDRTPRTNDWVGSWTKKAQDMGINSQADFLGANTGERGEPKCKVIKNKKGDPVEIVCEQNPEKIKNAQKAQEEAVRAYHHKLWEYILHRQLDEYVGEDINGVKITESALIAGYHLVGLGAKSESSPERKGLYLYLTTGGRIDPTDGKEGNRGTPVSKYIKRFNNYEVPFKKGVSIRSPQKSKSSKIPNKKTSSLNPQGSVPQRNNDPASIRDRWWVWDSNNFDDSLADRWKNLP
jgi:hypothetical protein